MDFDKTNTAIAFIDDGLFCAKAIQDKRDNGNTPILKILINLDGVDKELALWLSTDKQSGEYRLTKNGNKMLTGTLKVNDYKSAQNPPQPTANNEVQFDDDIPF